ncbi:putative ribonuclease H-like domain-containing protein, partial [Tanacetum coccineum]
EPKKVIQALKDPSWIEAMQEELLQFKLQQVWTLVDLPHGKRAIGTKWVYMNKKNERGIVIRNEASNPVARIDAFRLFLAYASYKYFMVYQMDVKSAFLYGKIKEEVYVCQPLDDVIFGSTKKKLCTEFKKMMHKKFQMSSMGELTFFLGLQVKQKEDGIFISQDKYVTEILKKFGFSDVKTANTPMETHKPLLKDADGEDVDEHMYRSMIGSLMYLTSSRPDIMFVVCVCARFQVNPKVSHLHAVKRIFRYLKGQPKLGLWYPKDSPFDLVAYTDSDYAGASLDRKSTIGGCQFLGCRLISWQCKKQTVVANSITEAEYVAASSCCGQVLWIQNQLLDYGDSLMDKQYRQEDIQELMSKLLEDVRNISEEFSEYINCPSWNRPLFYFDNDDDEYTVIWRRPKAITQINKTEIPMNQSGVPDNSLTDFDPNDDTSSDDDSFENIEYVDTSPSYLELDSLEEENEDQEEKEFNLEDIFQIQDVEFFR